MGTQKTVVLMGSSCGSNSVKRPSLNLKGVGFPQQANSDKRHTVLLKTLTNVIHE